LAAERLRARPLPVDAELQVALRREPAEPLLAGLRLSGSPPMPALREPLAAQLQPQAALSVQAMPAGRR
jgi:hypothetical protein